MTRTPDDGSTERLFLYATGRAWSQLDGTPLRQLPGELPPNLYADAVDAAGGRLWGAAVELVIHHGYPPAVVIADTGDYAHDDLTRRLLTWRAGVLLHELRLDLDRASA